ncbi:haloacid dehalogenase [Pantoea phage Kyle]|uniref:Haloacid dehalogenase n=1 Tax=Pantoea phage Kyle TaxID=2589665 RepID=A0A514A8Q3_9CAUD|nr:polynucleotide kinase/phosphorylase [Pantoea phage Kyle]QDH49635.1 haloacid dehalogenase [Pantoea phage Kyle]
MTNRTLAIFDLDGCTIDDSHRVPLIDWANRNFDAYHSEEQMAKDTALPIGSHLVAYALAAGMDIAFFTARPQRIFGVTKYQLNHVIGISDDQYKVLAMRADHEDGVPSATLKRQMLEKFLLMPGHEYEHIIAFDDHPDVIKMYREFDAAIIEPWLVTKKMVIAGGNEHIIAKIRKGESQEVDSAFPVRFKGRHDFVFKPHTTMRCATNPLIAALLKETDDSTLAYPCSAVELGDYYTRAAVRPVEVPEKLERTQPVDTLDALRAQYKSGRIAADVLEEAAATFRERNAVYKDNALVVGKVMAALFPNGVELKTQEDYNMWHLFELLIVKLTRFTNSGLTHQDSILDLTVYAAMLEPLINTHTIKIK